MDHHLPLGIKAADQQVRVSVARQQRRLEKQHGRGPHGGRATEPRQNNLGDERLHLEQEEGAEKNGGGVEKHA